VTKPDPLPLQAPVGAPPSSGEVAGDVIDRYELLELLGAGGMGTVWLAQQSEPVRREVALKVIKLGMDTREVVVRFEVERQALALMDHPHIAKVLDGGATASGRPYFVMERVDGTPITAYCDAHQLSLRERLELFKQVCDAIQHAHLKGIIHRDIKPSNVLVSLQDGVAAPKVIDFGIAKATSADLTQKTLHTQVTAMIGTPEYMAPEQAGSGSTDIDTRADVYSLGALLYELLTGTTPFDLRATLETGYEELLRTIRAVDPAKPSARVSTLGAAAPAVAARRRANVAVLRARLRGDLDWIVMKALEKERDRRYGTASELAADVERYLNEEPVEAAPPSTRYRLAKFVRRRRKTVAAVALIAFLLVAGSVGTGIGLWRTLRANRALDVALEEKGFALVEEERQRGLAESNAARARSAEQEARAEAERARLAEGEANQRALELEQVTDFQSMQLASIDVALMGDRLRSALSSAVTPEDGAGLADVLDEVNFTDIAFDSLEQNLLATSIEAIDSQFAEQPVVRATLLQSIGMTLQGMTRREAAVDPLTRALALRREALGNEDPATLRSISNLAYLFEKLGRKDEAEAYFREAIDGFRRNFGAEHSDTLIVMNNMALMMWGEQRLDEAEALIVEAHEIARRVFGDDDPLTLSMEANRGSLLRDQGRPAEAEPYLVRAVESNRRLLGDDDPETLDAIHGLAMLLRTMGRQDEAEPLAREVLERRRRILGNDHIRTIASIANLGGILRKKGELAEAAQYLTEALEGTRRVLGPDHRHTLSSANNLGRLLLDQGRIDEAEPLLWEAFVGFRRGLGAQHATTRQVLERFGQVQTARVEAAEAAGDDEGVGLILARVGAVHLLLEQYEVTEELLTKASELQRRTLPDGDARRWQLASDLGATMAAQGRYAEAQPLLVQSAKALLAGDATPAAVGFERTDAARAAQRVVEFFEARHAVAPEGGHAQSAREWRDRYAAWLGEHTPNDDD
jgi:eukaryotic-like serine/threonine-protein kinase